jgi:Acetyltransferases, including N-acetylases of ribosomal proteins
MMRPLTADDLDELAALRSDPQVMKYIGEQTREKVAERLRFYIESYEKNGYGACGISLKGETALIGWSGLQPLEDSGEVEIGYGFQTPYWGKGFATEVAAAWLRYGFEHIGLKRIVAIALPDNTASWRVMEKLGMKYEKNAKHYGFDVVYYAIAREDFQPDENALYVLHE